MRLFLTALIGTLLVLSSCQKEKSFERSLPAKGSLQNTGGDCLPKKVNGAYITAQALNDSNYIEVNVDVVQAGDFNIYTDTVNGYFFIGQGKFPAAGSYVVRIPGSGSPQAEGDDRFTVFF